MTIPCWLNWEEKSVPIWKRISMHFMRMSKWTYPLPLSVRGRYESWQKSVSQELISISLYLLCTALRRTDYFLGFWKQRILGSLRHGFFKQSYLPGEGLKKTCSDITQTVPFRVGHLSEAADPTCAEATWGFKLMSVISVSKLLYNGNYIWQCWFFSNTIRCIWD